MRAVDTNVLVRLVTQDDPAQADRAEAFVAAGGWVSHLALAETTWVLDAVYERTPKAIASAVELLLNHERLAIQEADVVRAALAHFQKRPALKFSDCLLVEIARHAGHLPFGTFDRDLSKLPGAQRVT